MTVPNPPTGIIDAFIRPPIGLLTPSLDENGPYSGNRTLTTWSQGPGPVFTSRPVSQSYGVILQLSGAIPIGWGFVDGWRSDDGQYDESRYDPPLAQLVAQHRFTNGVYITTNNEVVAGFPFQVLWNVAFPGRIGLRVAPHLAFDLFYLILV